MAIPATKEEAIEALVKLDVALWGNEHLHAAQNVHNNRTYASALNELANRAEANDSGPHVTELRAAAVTAMEELEKERAAQRESAPSLESTDVD